MWKFLKNLFKKQTKPDLMFFYDEETQVILKEKPNKEEWDVIINTTKDLNNEDLMRILASARKRIS